MKLTVKTSSDQLVEKANSQNSKNPGGGTLCLASRCPFEAINYFKKAVNYPLGLASFIK